MLTMLQNWQGAVEINGVEYDSIKDATNAFKRKTDEIHIILKSNHKNANMSVTDVSNDASNDALERETEYQITVKPYMTKKSSVDFDFMLKWNNDVPMPMRIMQGTVEKETRGMVYMKLHGLAKPTITCYCCGKELTNPISRHYGIGPICLGKLGITRDIDDVENIRDELVNIEWEGWVIRSSILKKEIVEND